MRFWAGTCRMRACALIGKEVACCACQVREPDVMGDSRFKGEEFPSP